MTITILGSGMSRELMRLAPFK